MDKIALCLQNKNQQQSGTRRTIRYLQETRRSREGQKSIGKSTWGV